jgi:predicted CXXCH cytochrome family protein
MQEATEASVGGAFSGATFTYAGVTSRFFTRDGAFVVRTDGADGTLGEFPVRYVFGIEPLQQYLFEFPGGRLQALGIAWDTRPRERAGQRWFHLYPGERIRHDDPLHWTRPAQTWNLMCADCHSTGVRKNFDLPTGTYRTTWAEINVSCEACHGPGSRHVAWAENRAAGRGGKDQGDRGLLVDLRDRSAGVWRFEPDQPIARRSAPPSSQMQLETCATCHSLHTKLAVEPRPGAPLLDRLAPRLLDADAYHADGQILGEVYEYGSFVQSRMFRAGVRCSDCHDPHSLGLRAEGNALCSTCHRAEVYDTPKHHFHRPRSAGARCVECHMAARTYMVVDPRRDHSFRVPRPDQSVALGTPNACTGCHAGQPATWAAAAVARWYGPKPRAPHFAQALHAARARDAAAPRALTALAADHDQPAIARATALQHLADHPGPGSLPAIAGGLADPDPLVRRAALAALDGTPVPVRLQHAVPRLSDPVLGVRLEAARVLAPVPQRELSREQSVALRRAIDEYIRAQEAVGDFPAAHLNLGVLHQRRGDPDRAEAAYRTALRLVPEFVPAWLNLAELMRERGSEAGGERILREGLRAVPTAAALHHALGLALVRQQRPAEALPALARAAQLDPASARFAYVYGVALHSLGRPRPALMVLETVRRRYPRDPEILAALATISRDVGRYDDALRYAEGLAAAMPDDPRARRLVEEIRQTRNR